MNHLKPYTLITPSQLIEESMDRIKKEFPQGNYPVTSPAGQELESMVYSLMDLRREGLSEEEYNQRESLLKVICEEKLRGFV